MLEKVRGDGWRAGAVQRRGRGRASGHGNFDSLQSISGRHAALSKGGYKIKTILCSVQETGSIHLSCLLKW